MIVKVTTQFDYKFNKKTNRIEKYALDPLNQRSHMMLLEKGIENTMIQRVNEISESFIKSNGEQENNFKFYQAGNSNVLNTPF